MIIQHRFYKCTALIMLLIFMAIMPAKAALISDFTGPYSLNNWTETIGGNGAIDLDGFSSVTLTSSDQGNTGSQDQIDVDLTIMAAASGFVSFYWSYETHDIDKDPIWDPFGYLLNDVFFQLTYDKGGLIQTGQTRFFVNTGDIFGFRQKTEDDQFGAGITTISQFRVPEPHISILFGMGLAFFLLTYSRRLKRS